MKLCVPYFLRMHFGLGLFSFFVSFSCFLTKKSQTFRLNLNPCPPSGPRGCRITTIFLPPRAASSKFIVFSFDIKRSGLLDELCFKKSIRNGQKNKRKSLPQLAHATGRVFSRAFVGDNDEFDFVALLQQFSAFDFARVKKQLLSLFNFVTQKAKLTFK